MKQYESLFKRYREQELDTVFAHFPAVAGDYDAKFKELANITSDGYDQWIFHQPRFIQKYHRTSVPKLKNYLDYTFTRLQDLERDNSGKYFVFSSDGSRVCFNTGLQNSNQSDLIATFQKATPNPLDPNKPITEWVYRGCWAPIDYGYRNHFPQDGLPEFAWYSTDSRDYVFDTSYKLDSDVFDHMFVRAKERAGMPNASDDAVRIYLRGTLQDMVFEIRRNYKVAIPVYYVNEKRMQLLLPFPSFSDKNEYASFLIDRDDTSKRYRIKTIFDLDQAYFSARLITRPDRDWLNP